VPKVLKCEGEVQRQPGVADAMREASLDAYALRGGGGGPSRWSDSQPHVPQPSLPEPTCRTGRWPHSARSDMGCGRMLCERCHITRRRVAVHARTLRQLAA